MPTFRNRVLLASAAIAGLMIPAVGLAENNSPNEQQNNQQQQQQSQDNQNNQGGGTQLSGTVQSYREVNVDGTQHFRVRLKSDNNSTQTVDFGPTDQASQAIDNIEQGERISVSGQRNKIDGKSVFEAEQAKIEGKTYDFSGENSAQANTGDEGNGQGSQANSQNKGQQPQAVVLLNERMVFVDEGDVNRHLILAKENLRMGDNRAAAGELLVAADQLRMYQGSEQGQNQQNQQGQSQDEQGQNEQANQEQNPAHELNESINSLRRLAGQVQKQNADIKPQEIDKAAAHAQAALASYFENRVESGQLKNPIEKGYALRSAAVHTREALLWSDQDVSSKCIQCVHKAMETADNLISGQSENNQNVTQVAQGLQQEIQQADQQNDHQAQPAGAKMSPDQEKGQSSGTQNQNNDRSDGHQG